MLASDFLSILTQATFLAVFIRVTWDTIRRPQLARLEMALFFGVIAAIIVISDAARLLGFELGPVLLAVVFGLLVALPYLLFRILGHFEPQDRRLSVAAFIGFLGLIAATPLAVAPGLGTAYQVAVIVWFAALGGYASIGFARLATRSRGITGRRMQAVAIGTGLIALAVVIALLQTFLGEHEAIQIVTQLAGLAAGVAFFLGLAPPVTVRRLWQEPELRAFLERAAFLPRLPDLDSILRELQRWAAAATGAPSAVIGLWRPERGVIDYHQAAGGWVPAPSDAYVAGRAFSRGRAIFSADAARDDPAHAEEYAEGGVVAILAAPIRIGDQPMGVLAVYAPRAPIFADDDLRLVQTLADQTAIVLESRRLIEESARVQARGEAARLKEDFLSSAAHDLRTPVTTILLQAELLMRAAARDSERPVDRQAVGRIVTEAGRLRRLVGEILDAAWAGRPPEVQREPVDLAELARESARRVPGAYGRVTVESDAALVGAFDGERIRQVFDNLVDNAVKYSPSGGEVTVRLERAGEAARITVADRGIGVPAGDLPRLFERFHRGSNVDDRRFRGLGLGLAITRRIVEQHGGTITARSEVGVGTTIEVTLPLLTADRGQGSDGDGDARLVADAPAVPGEPAAESTYSALEFAPGDV